MRFLDRFAASVEQAKSFDPVAEKLAAITEKAGMGKPIVRDALSGTAAGHPLHPLLVTVPIGAWVIASVFDVLPGYKKPAQTLVGIGIASAAPTIAAGLSDWRYTAGAERRVGIAHALGNSVALSLYTASYLARRRGHHGLGVLTALAGAGALSVSGWLGGHLSYALGVGVDTTAFIGGGKDWTPVASRDEVLGNELVAKTVDGASVLLAEVDGEVVAMLNRCSHRGAPLTDGERVGDCVRCPWHDSEFALQDGAVEVGPATRPQPMFDVRVRDNQIEVKRRALSALQANSV